MEKLKYSWDLTKKNFDKLSIEHKLRLRLCEIIHSPPLCLYSFSVDIDSDIKLNIIEKAIAWLIQFFNKFIGLNSVLNEKYRSFLSVSRLRSWGGVVRSLRIQVVTKQYGGRIYWLHLQISALLCIALELLHGAKVLNMSWSEVASYELCG